MRTTIVARLIIVCLLTVVGLSCGGGVQAQGEGSISGAVTDPGGTPLEGCWVTADGDTSGSASTDADGLYSITDLAADEYTVSVYCEGYPVRYYDNVPYVDRATAVNVAGGQNVTLDFRMGSLAGVISGKVTDALGGPFQRCTVSAYPSEEENGFGFRVGVTDEDGLYTISDLPVDGYTLYAYCNETISEYYDGVHSPDEATLVHVIEDQETTGIDFSVGGAISGRVTSATGDPVAGCGVLAWSEEPRGSTGIDVTDAAGYYAVSPLPADSYFVTASCEGFADRYYDGALDWQDADLVVVIDGQNTPNIDLDVGLEGDGDGDGILDEADNCPRDYNPDQANSDGGRRPNGTQIPGEWASNPAQDRMGDACDPDDDNDLLRNEEEFDDHCPYRLVADSDGDGQIDSWETGYLSNPCDPQERAACHDTTDWDGDGLNFCLERTGYNTCTSTNDPLPGWSSCATPMDSDGDGCADVLEVMDINGDRKVSVGDQTLLAKRGAGLFPPSSSDSVFDVNKDGKISVGDQTLMAKNTCFLKPSLPGCQAPSCPAE